MNLAQPGNQNPNQPQSAPTFLHRFARGLGRISLALACIGILVFLAILGYSYRLTAETKAAVDVAASAQVQLPAPATTLSDLQKAIEAAVDASIKRDELLLDKLLLVVGLYSTILSVLALATVFASRQDAKEQLVSVNARADALASTVQQQLAAIQAKALKDVEALKTQVRAEFPIISQLQSRVLNLILKLEAKYPEEQNWNRSLPNSWKIEERQQDILIDEMQILTVSVVVLDDANLHKLYLVLARSYLERFRTGSLTDGDAARAYLYAGRAIECNRSSAEAYRMRGVVALSRFDTASPERRSTDEFRGLLEHAKQDFTECKNLDPLNAGAFYNLALIGQYEGELDRAIQISEDLLALKKEVSRKAKEKYFPDVYLNLACFIAQQSAAVTAPVALSALHDRIVRVCTEGRDYLMAEVSSSRAMDNFKESLKRELGANGDFAGLPATTRAALEALL
jgi:tetratricopeptide (TPR) repeat protein